MNIMSGKSKRRRFLALAAAAALTLSLTVSVAAANPDLAEDETFVNDTDPAITYSDGWGHGDQRIADDKAAGGGYAYANADNTTAQATLTFTGTGIKAVMLKQNGCGFVNVSIDGGTPTQININPAAVSGAGDPPLWGQIAFEKTNLSNEEHTITISNTDGGWGYSAIFLEGFIVTKPASSDPVTPSDPVFPAETELTKEQIEDSPFFVSEKDPSVLYTGSWGKDPGENYAGGERAYTSDKDASVQLFFTGSHLKVLMALSPTANGFAELFVDGERKTIVSTKIEKYDMDKEEFYYNAVVYSADDLDPDAVHSVRLANTKEGESWIYPVGFLVEKPVANPDKYAAESDPGFADDNSGSITYSAGWDRDTAAETLQKAAGEGRMYTNTKDAKATFTFTGNEIQILMTKHSDSGVVEIAIDGGEPEQVDTASGASSTLWAQTVFVKKGFAVGEHTVTVTNVSEGGKYVYLEGFIASEGPVVLDPKDIAKQPGFINDNDSHLVFKGSWGKGDQAEFGRIEDEAFAGGGYAYLSKENLSEKSGGVMLRFEGTEISVLMQRKSGNGYVDIYLDGKQMINAEDGTGLWNTNTLGAMDPNAVIFSRTGLDEGEHTIEVYSADGGYGYGWIYLTGFLTDGHAVAYQEETVPSLSQPSASQSTAPTSSAGGATQPVQTAQTPQTTEAVPSNTDTGTAAPIAMLCLAAAAGVTLWLVRRSYKLEK